MGNIYKLYKLCAVHKTEQRKSPNTKSDTDGGLINGNTLKNEQNII